MSAFYRPIFVWLASPLGRLVAAAIICAAVAGLERAPRIRDWLKGWPEAKRALAVLITVLGAIATALLSDVPLEQVAEAAVTALLAATGLNTLTKRLKPPVLP